MILDHKNPTKIPQSGLLTVTTNLYKFRHPKPQGNKIKMAEKIKHIFYQVGARKTFSSTLLKLVANPVTIAVTAAAAAAPTKLQGGPLNLWHFFLSQVFFTPVKPTSFWAYWVEVSSHCRLQLQTQKNKKENRRWSPCLSGQFLVGEVGREVMEGSSLTGGVSWRDGALGQSMFFPVWREKSLFFFL